MARRKVLIIGGGIAGLAAGTYLRMNGYDTEIFEQHTLPGGLCTAWTRRGYTFDFCIHWLMGSGPSKNLHAVWRDLGAIDGRRYIEWEEYGTVTLKNGKLFTIYTDPDTLYKEMARFSPEDKKLSRELCDAIKKLSGFDFPINRGDAGFAQTLTFMIKMVAYLPYMLKWGRMTIPRFIERLKGEDLKQVFRMLYGEEMAADFPVVGMIIMLAFMHTKSAGYPLGGSLEFAKAIEKKYLSLGGAIRYGFKVDTILVQSGAATGIRGNGEEHRGDIVLSAADGHATLYEMLEGKYLTPRLVRAYEQLRVFPSLVYVCIGIKKDLSSVSHMQTFSLSKPIVLEDGKLTVEHLTLRLYHFDPSMAPRGGTSAIVMLPTFNTPWWTDLRSKDPARYREEKKRIGAEIVAALDGFIGDIQKNVEVIDVSTPATVVRYTNNWKGSYEGFLPTRKSMMGGNLGHTIPGLKNFYMVGQWVNPGGGLPPCVMDGLRIAGMICKEDGKKFTVGSP